MKSRWQLKDSDNLTDKRQRIALAIQYLGTHFQGWQRQGKGERTVQEELEKAIASVIDQPVPVVAAGRTDTGVHAAAQVAHFDVSGPIPPERWATILNSRLPEDILIRGSAQVAPTWHARFSALWRRYRYTLYTQTNPNLFVRHLTWHYYYQSLDANRIQAALDPLLGRHHLSAFHRAGSSRKHSWVDIQTAQCTAQDPFMEIEVQANGFLYGMMRLLVGLLVKVGTAEITPTEFTHLWQEERRDLVKYAAPAQGLCLLRVGYPDPPFPPEVWFDTQPQFKLG